MTRRAQRLIRDYPASVLAAEPVTAEAIGRAAAAEDPLGVRILDETAEMLGAWLGSMISLLDPDVIVIGGGVAQIGEPLFSRLRRITPTGRCVVRRIAPASPTNPVPISIRLLGSGTAL